MMGLGMEVWDMALGRVGRIRVGRAEVLVLLLGLFGLGLSFSMCLSVSVWVSCLLLWVPWLFGSGGLPRFALSGVFDSANVRAHYLTALLSKNLTAGEALRWWGGILEGRGFG